MSKKKWSACGACPNCTPLAVVCASTSSPHRTPPWNGTSPSQSSAGLKHPAPITPARCAAAECRAALALSRTAVALRCSPRRDAPRRTPPCYRAGKEAPPSPWPPRHLARALLPLVCSSGHHFGVRYQCPDICRDIGSDPRDFRSSKGAKMCSHQGIDVGCRHWAEFNPDEHERG